MDDSKVNWELLRDIDGCAECNPVLIHRAGYENQGPDTLWYEWVVGGKVKKPGKRGRKPAKIDLKAKLERSRQSARECRARKKLRYQYLEELVSSRERAICALREELEMYKQWCMAMDQGKIPSEIKALLTGEEQSKSHQNSTKLAKAGKTETHSNNPW
uniref:cAMP-responsive element-binding protein-like 2 n=1 Tax=Gopherus evgoodei TaxID=1825980 RepID=A0A8C4VRS3_9SAUR